MKLKDDILLEQAYSSVLEEAKKKKVNPWAVCNTTTKGKKKEPEKFEKCVKGVKKKTGFGSNKKKVVKENIAPNQQQNTISQSPTNTVSTQQKNEPDELITLLQNVKDPDIKKALEQIAKQREIAKVEQAASAPTIQSQNQQFQSQM
jgi:hypothetical protein